MCNLLMRFFCKLGFSLSFGDMKRLWQAYAALVKSKLVLDTDEELGGLHYWQNRLFVTFLIYSLPVSLIALIPCVYIAVQDGYFLIALVDLLAFFILAVITFTGKLTLKQKKTSVLAILYPLAIFLIHQLGYVGPGVFYLFFLTVLLSLILPVRFAYWSIAANAALLGIFALIIRFNVFDSVLSAIYTPGAWLAFSSNLIFASIVVVTLIHRIFEKLQATISKTGQLQDRYKSIFDKSPMPMWIFDTETLAFIEVNDAAVAHYGYSKQEFMTMTIRDIRPDKAVPLVETIVDFNKKTGNFYEGTSQHIKKDGHYIYVKIESNLLQLGNKLVRLVLATDITEQVEHQLEAFNTNKKVKESEANLRTVFNSTVDGYVLLDAKLKIKLFNTRAFDFIRLNSRKQEFEVGRSIYDFVEPSRLPYFKNVMEKVGQGEIIDYDRRHHSADGVVSWIRYTLTPVYNNGAVKGACISGRDITVRKLYLKTVEDQNKTFREISWMQSHLVRAPLARIMGLIPLLNAAADKCEQAEIINYMDLSAKELDGIVQKITDKSYSMIYKYPVDISTDLSSGLKSNGDFVIP
jgi:PAS domain S-box-containing protein